MVVAAPGMTGIPLRIIDEPAPGAEPQPGDMWRDDFGGLLGWAIVLPNHAVWHTWQPSRDGICWDVCGEAPDLTVSQPINDSTPGREWRGRIRNGHLLPA